MKKTIFVFLPVFLISLNTQAAVTRSCSYSYSGGLTTYQTVVSNGQTWNYKYVENETSGGGTVSGRAATANRARKEARDKLLGSFNETAKNMARSQLAKAPSSSSSKRYNVAYGIELKITGDTNCNATRYYSGSVWP
jgi:hypothetical protein